MKRGQMIVLAGFFVATAAIFVYSRHDSKALTWKKNSARKTCKTCE
jgi:hypothetical protein